MLLLAQAAQQVACSGRRCATTLMPSGKDRRQWADDFMADKAGAAPHQTGLHNPREYFNALIIRGKSILTCKDILAASLFLICVLSTTTSAQVNQGDSQSGSAGSEPALSTFRGGPQRNGAYKGTGFFAANRVLWRYRTGGPVQSSPALFDGSIYVGSNDGYLYCLAAGSGELRWRFKASASVSSSPAIANGVVYFQADDNHFYAVDARQGRVKWELKTGANVPFDGRCVPCGADLGDAGAFDFWASSPALAGGSVYFGSGDSYLYSLDAVTGRLQWKYKTGGRVRSSPAIYKGLVYAGSLDGTMYALDAARGTLRWRFKTEGNEYFKIGEIQSSPAIAAGLVVFGSRDYNLYALDAETGALKWKNLVKESWILSSPAIANDGVFVGSSDGKSIRKVDLLTGKELWTTAVPGNVFSSPAVAGGYVYVGDIQGDMLGLDEQTGKIRMGRLTDARINSSPLIADGVVYYGAENGYVYAIAGGKPPVAKKPG
jgi:outer membrane protein assembly factor BamB